MNPVRNSTINPFATKNEDELWADTHWFPDKSFNESNTNDENNYSHHECVI